MIKKTKQVFKLKSLLLLFFLSLYTFSFAQKIHPKKGKITFTLLKKDSVLTVLHFAGKRIEPVRERKFIHEFQDSIIKHHEVFRRENGTIDIGKSKYISKKLGRTYAANSNDEPIYNRSYEYPYKDYRKETFRIVERSNKKKKIKGFKCFHIIIEGTKKYSELHKVLTIYDMYVTEKIKCDYHPVLEAKSFLENYYPLEIKVSATSINNDESATDYMKKVDKMFNREYGKVKLYTLESIEIN